MQSSVRLSARHTGGSVKTVDVRIIQYIHRTVAPSLWYMRDKFHDEIMTASNKGGVGKQAIYETSTRWSKVTTNV